jgi:uncharacterized membrane protein
MLRTLSGVLIGVTVTTLIAAYWRTVIVWAFTRGDIH